MVAFPRSTVFPVLLAIFVAGPILAGDQQALAHEVGAGLTDQGDGWISGHAAVSTTAKSDYLVGINCGGEEFLGQNGDRYLADRAYTVSAGSGYVGGHTIVADYEWDPIDGTADDDLYRTGRSAMAEYRFDVPNGPYLVTLFFAEIEHHGPGLRSFAVEVEDRPVLDGLDIYARVQHDYALGIRVPVWVQDSQLNVTFAGQIGDPVLSAIRVIGRSPDISAPAVPSPPDAVGSYRQIVLNWRDGLEVDLAGYHVCRATGSGPCQVQTEEPVFVSRYIDDDVDIGLEYCYQVLAVDVYGNASAFGSAVCQQAITPASSMLPYFSLTVPDANLRRLNAAPRANSYVTATLVFLGYPYEVEARYRGNVSRVANKKSWRIRGEEVFPIFGQDRLQFSAQGYEASLIKEKVISGMFEDVGAAPVRVEFVNLQLNGRFAGVFSLVEVADQDYLVRTGRNARGNLYKCMDNLADLWPTCEPLIHESRSHEDLYELLVLLQDTPEVELARTMADILDLRGFLEFLAIQTLVGNRDAIGQFLLYHDTDANLWEVLPWDNNRSFAQAATELPVDFMTANLLAERVLRTPQYRRYFGERLLELMDGLFSPSSMQARFDDAVSIIQADAERDYWKVGREDQGWFYWTNRQLAPWVASRVAYLRSEIQSYMPDRRVYLTLNEVQVHNHGSIYDPADGDPEPWIELYNAGLEAVDLGGMYLTDNPANPTRFRIAQGTVVPPLGWILFWADGEPEQGPTHLNFELGAGNGSLGFYTSDGVTVMDALTYDHQAAGQSLGRFPDGSGEWITYGQSSPEQSNRLPAPSIVHVVHTPTYPQADSSVSVQARIVDDGQVASATLHVRLGPDLQTVPMYDDGHHGDGGPGDHVYAAQIPAQAQGTKVSYYVSALDNHGRNAKAPRAAPAVLYDYVVGFQPIPVIINEFMASNRTVLEDPDEPGEYPDWIELLNVGMGPVDLGGMHLSDERASPNKYRIPPGLTILPGEHLLFYADDDPEQGPRHANFKLSASSEAVLLIAANGQTEVDAIVYDSQRPDVAFGRCPDAGPVWQSLAEPSPETGNVCRPLFLPFVCM